MLQFPPAMTATMLALTLVAIAAAIVVARGSYLALARVRARRRTVWQLDRDEWRRWIGRP